MKLTNESKILLGILGASVAIVAIATVFFSQSPKSEPALSREQLITNDTQSVGNASASAYLVEFSDYQCPACKSAKPFVDAVVEEYKEKLIFAYRHFPLDQHQYAVKAAVAAEAAGLQGKYWEMHNLLFANQEKLSDDLFSNLARELSLDQKQFTEALANPKLKENVIRDRDYGISIGINSTPTFFLNGKKVILASFSDLKTEVERVLQ